MNWKYIRSAPWLDTRARFISGAPRGACLLDLGSSDGETLCHIRELRPDLKLLSTDIEGTPQNYPPHTDFARLDLQTESLPWSNQSVDIITCMHLVEHMNVHDHLLTECFRVLRPGGLVYIETPHPKSLCMPSPRGSFAGQFTLNFYDDITHVRIVSVGAIAKHATKVGFTILNSGASRNILFAAAWLVFRFLPSSRKSLTAHTHWIGWSAFIVLRKPLA
jgi:SAM-dependent methyltransferase